VGATGIERASETLETAGKPAPSPDSDVAKSPVGDVSPGPLPDPAADLARALKLAAEAGQWEIVSLLARQLEAMRREGDGDATGRALEGVRENLS
jgi:hypothetical protein